MGTNTFLLLVADVEGGHIRKVLHDESRVVRLGQEVNKTRRLHPEALARAEKCLREFSQTLQALGAERTAACATSAARDVTNAAALLAVARKHGIPTQIISGEREAELTFKGTISAEKKGPLVLIDIGGGSTEFVFGYEGKIVKRLSLDIGSVRLTEMFVTKHPISPPELEKMQDFVDEQMERALAHKPLGPEWSSFEVIAVSGTPTSLATLDQARPFESDLVHGHKMTKQSIRGWVDRLAALSVEQRQKLAGMEPKRADVLVAGALILATAVAALGASGVEVSIRGLRYGVAMEEEERAHV